jgi:hypothetical protein
MIDNPNHEIPDRLMDIATVMWGKVWVAGCNGGMGEALVRERVKIRAVQSMLKKEVGDES